MKPLQSRFETVEKHINEKNITVMIIGLGSVGTYLLDYLVSRNDEALKVVVVENKLAGLLIVAEKFGLIKHAVDQGGLAMVDVSYNCNITNVLHIENIIKTSCKNTKKN